MQSAQQPTAATVPGVHLGPRSRAGATERMFSMAPHRLVAVPGDSSAAAAAVGVFTAVASIVTAAHALALGLLLGVMLLELITSDHSTRKAGRPVPSTTEDLKSKGRRLAVVISAWMMDAFMVTAAHASGIGAELAQHGPVLGVTIAYLFYREWRQVLVNIQRVEGDQVIPPQLVSAAEASERTTAP